MDDGHLYSEETLEHLCKARDPLRMQACELLRRGEVWDENHSAILWYYVNERKLAVVDSVRFWDFYFLITNHEDPNYPLTTEHPKFAGTREWLATYNRPLTYHEFMSPQWSLRGHVVVEPYCPEYMSRMVFSMGLLCRDAIVYSTNVLRLFCGTTL